MELGINIISTAVNLTPKNGKSYLFNWGLESNRNERDQIIDYDVWLLPLTPRRSTNKFTGKIKKFYSVVMTVTARNNGSADVDIQDTNTTVNNLVLEIDDFAESMGIKLAQNPVVDIVNDFSAKAIYFEDDQMRSGVLVTGSFETQYIDRDYCLTGVTDYALWDDNVTVLWDDGTPVEFR